MEKSIGSLKHLKTQSGVRPHDLPMYNGPSVHMTDRPFVNVVHYQYVALF